MRAALDGAGSIEALSSTSFEVRFDRFLLPATAVRQSICLRSGTTPVATIQDCSGSIRLEPTYDPVRRVATFHQVAGTRLAPATTYQVTVLAPPDETNNGFRAFDGAPLAANVELRFKTTDVDPAGSTDELPLGGDLFCCLSACDPSIPNCTVCPIEADGASATLSTCAYAPCHASSPPQAEHPLGASMGLDLSPPGDSSVYADAILSTAIHHVAHQTQTGETAADPNQVSTERFGRAMPIIAPGNPGHSYMLYKLATDVRNFPPGEAPSDAEIARLRASFVAGMPMPPTQGSPVSARGLELLSAWIAAGAPTRRCFE